MAGSDGGDPRERLSAAVRGFDARAAAARTGEALAAGADPQRILEGLLDGMRDVGRRFKGNEVFVPEVLMASRAMKAAMALLEPRLESAGVRPTRTVVIGTVQGDLHDIGKNLVAMMWRGAHLAVVDVGVNAPADRFVEAQARHGADLIGVSALLTTTLPAMRAAVERIRRAVPLPVRIVVGGAPVTAAFAEEIGADGFAPDAVRAVDLVDRLLAKGPHCG